MKPKPVPSVSLHSKKAGSLFNKLIDYLITAGMMKKEANSTNMSDRVWH